MDCCNCTGDFFYICQIVMLVWTSVTDRQLAKSGKLITQIKKAVIQTHFIPTMNIV